jgi:hypothetical protein
VAKPDFVTLADALIGSAEAAETYFETDGYTVVREPDALDYPYTPTLRCKRHRTTMVVEVDNAIRIERMREWMSYGRASNTDFRVAVVTPHDKARQLDAEEAVRSLGAGIYQAGGASLAVELHMPHDLSVNVSLPDLSKMPPKVKRALGPMYEQIRRSQWREGFETGCQAFEDECRRYLKKGVAGGRIVVLDKSGHRRHLTDTMIDRFTMGQLATAFARIQTPNHADTALAKILVKIRPRRNAVVHKKTTPATEARLRKNVGKDVWLLFAGVKTICDVK